MTVRFVERIAGLCMVLMIAITMAESRRACAGGGSIASDGTMFVEAHFRFEPTNADVLEVKTMMQLASEDLCDATDGQLRISLVRLSAGRGWSEEHGDIWLLPEPGRSFVSFRSDGSGLGRLGTHISLLRDGLKGDVIAHELGHLALGLGDEYEEQCRFGGPCGIGPCFDSGVDSQNNCLMQQNGNELCVEENHDLLLGEPGGDDGVCGMPSCTTETCDAIDCSVRWNTDTNRSEVTQQELLHPGQSCWETIVDNYPFLTMPAGLPFPEPPSICDLKLNFIDAVDGPEQVFLVIDKSGSMRSKVGPGATESRLDFAKAGARVFVDWLANRNSSVGLISFSTLAWLDRQLRLLDEDTVEGFKTDLNGLVADGQTSIGHALSLAAGQYASLALAGRSRTVVLLSDGQDNPLLGLLGMPLVPDALEGAEALRNANARLVTIPLGIGADRETMAELASVTRGKMLDAAAGDELPALYAEIAAFLLGEAVALPRTGSEVARFIVEGQRDRAPGVAQWLHAAAAKLAGALFRRWMPPAMAQTLPESEQFQFLVEAGSERLNVMLSSRNLDVTTWNPAFRLLGPGGVIIEETDPRVLSDSFYRIVQILAPPAGLWTLEVSARDTTIQRSFVLAHVENPVPDCFVSVAQETLGPGQTAVIDARASFVADLEGAVSFEGSVTRPDGSVVPLSFERDDLTRTNSAEFDAFVGRGNYDVTVRCEVDAGARVMPGEPIFPGPDLQVDVEPFERTVRTSFFLDVDTLPTCTVADCDQDGIPNDQEGTADIDGDGLPCDRDDDCDGDDLPDAEEGTGDADGDGIPDLQDPDADDDCLPDGGDPHPTVVDEPICGDGILCATEVCDQANDAICPGRCAPPGAADQCTCRPIDDYKCYKTRQVGDRFARRDVSLEDQFGPTIATIKRPQRLCNPVDADGQGIADPTAHLMCYVLDEPKLSTQNVIVDDRFGEHRLTVKRADSLCLPAEKDEVASALNIDHFKCYSTRRAKGTPRFTPVEIELDDQFEDKTTIVVRPRFLCNPLDKNGEGIEHPESHLLCYRIKDAPGQPRFRRRQVQIIDQFSIQDLKAIRGDCRASSFLCVRATKRLASEGADTP